MDQDIHRLVRMGRFRDALSSIGNAPLAIRRSPEYQVAEAELLVDTGDLQTASTLAVKTLERAPDTSIRTRALRVLGQIAFYEGNANSSREYLRKAYELAQSMRKSDPSLYTSVLLVRWRLFSKVA